MKNGVIRANSEGPAAKAENNVPPVVCVYI